MITPEGLEITTMKDSTGYSWSEWLNAHEKHMKGEISKEEIDQIHKEIKINKEKFLKNKEERLKISNFIFEEFGMYATITNDNVIKFDKRFNWGCLTVEFLNRLKKVMGLNLEKQDLGICWRNDELWIFKGWK